MSFTTFTAHGFSFDYFSWPDWDPPAFDYRAVGFDPHCWKWTPSTNITPDMFQRSWSAIRPTLWYARVIWLTPIVYICSTFQPPQLLFPRKNKTTWWLLIPVRYLMDEEKKSIRQSSFISRSGWKGQRPVTNGDYKSTLQLVDCAAHTCAIDLAEFTSSSFHPSFASFSIPVSFAFVEA